jgi:hypothetical protein
LAPVLAGFVLILPIAVSGADIQLGQDGQALPEKVDTPNLRSSAPGSPPSPAAPTTVPQQDPGTGLSGPALVEKVRRVWSHLLTDAPRRTPTGPAPAKMDDVIFGKPAVPVALNGPGQKEVVATADGPVKIEIFLSTYNPAAMEVHLIDTDGAEIFFKGRSLLLWQRPNDSSYAPVYFQGDSQPDSMYENNPGDFSPKPGLSYSYDIKQGQKLILKTGGNAEPSSYIRLKGPFPEVFRLARCMKPKAPGEQKRFVLAAAVPIRNGEPVGPRKSDPGRVDLSACCLWEEWSWPPSGWR